MKMLGRILMSIVRDLRNAELVKTGVSSSVEMNMMEEGEYDIIICGEYDGGLHRHTEMTERRTDFVLANTA